MKTKGTIEALLRKETGKRSVVILKKIDRMLKQGVSRAKIEKALVAELSAHLKKLLRSVGQQVHLRVSQR
jgi:hypothetical protein